MPSEPAVEDDTPIEGSPTRPVVMSFDGAEPSTDPQLSAAPEVRIETIFAVPPRSVMALKVGLTSADVEILAGIVGQLEKDPVRFQALSGYDHVDLKTVFSFLARRGIHQYMAALNATAISLSQALHDQLAHDEEEPEGEE